MTCSVTDGDDRENAKDGPDDTATAIVAPAKAARTPRVIRRGIMVSSRLPNDLNVLSRRLFCSLIKRIMKNLMEIRRWLPPSSTLKQVNDVICGGQV
jgi:hypothetical protein